MAHDGCQTPSWYGQAFSYLPSTHRAVPHEAPPSAASAFLSVAQTSGGYRSMQVAPSSYSSSGGAAPASAEDALRVARTGTWDGPAPRGRGKAAAPIEPVKVRKRLELGMVVEVSRPTAWRKQQRKRKNQNPSSSSSLTSLRAPLRRHYQKQPAPASRTQTSVSLGAGCKRLPLCGLRIDGAPGANVAAPVAAFLTSTSSTSSPLINLVVDAEDDASVAAAAQTLRGLSQKQRDEQVFLTLVIDGLGLSCSRIVQVLTRLRPSAEAPAVAADLVLLDWSKVIEAERRSPDDGEELGLSEQLWLDAAKDLLLPCDSPGGVARARAIGLANAGLADVERLLSLAEARAAAAREVPAEERASAFADSRPCPRPAALAVELHPLLPQRKLVGVCRRKGVALVALDPAGKGEVPTCEKTRALLESAAVAGAAATENKSPREVRSL